MTRGLARAVETNTVAATRKLLAAAAFGAFCGCATVVSERPNCKTDGCVERAGDGQTGVVYFLPKKHLRVTALLCDREAGPQACLFDEERESDVAKAAKDFAALGGATLNETATQFVRMRVTASTPEPDPSAMFYAKPKHNWFRDDGIFVSVGANGLLQSSRVVARSQETAVISTLGATILTGIAGEGNEDRDKDGTATAEPAPICNFKEGDVATALSLPLRLDMRIDPIEWMSHSVTATDNETEQAKAARERITAQKNALDSCFSRELSVERLFKPDDGEKPDTLIDNDYGGYAYRPELPYRIVVSRTLPYDPDRSEALAGLAENSAIVMLPNEAPVVHVPMRSAAFTQTETNVTFNDGIVTCLDMTRPSEGLEVVRLPLRVAGSAFAAVGQVLQFDAKQATTPIVTLPEGDNAAVPSASDIRDRVALCAPQL
ncbi:MAG: hypothetical protein AAGC56_09815 [Pseudomonadota bacterium]